MGKHVLHNATMKAKNVKAKVLEVNAKRTKAKLPRYKAKDKIVRGKRCSLMNSTQTNPKDVRKSLFSGKSVDKKHLASRCSLKKRKKKDAPVKQPGDRARDSMDRSLECGEGSSGARVTTDRDEKHGRDTPKQQTSIGSPLIVEALSGNLSSMSIPQAFMQNTNSRNDDSSHRVSRTRSTGQKEEASVVVARSVNRNDRYSGEVDSTSLRSSLNNNCRTREDRKPLDNESINAPTSAGTCNEAGGASKECLEPPNIDNVGADNGAIEIESGTSIDVDEPNDIYEAQGPVRFYCLRNKVVAIMAEAARFSFTGKLVLKVIYGAVEAYGYVISAETGSTNIYSPRGYSSVSIETSDEFSRVAQPDIWTSLSAEGITRGGENKLVANIDKVVPGMAVVLLSNLENKLTKFLSMFYPFGLFPKVGSLPYYRSWTDPRRAERILQSHIFVSNDACKDLTFEQPVLQEVCEKTLHRWRANQWSCTVVAGGKGVGKSTTMRYLINKLLPVSKKVVLVDLDPGQAECTPPACISYTLIEEPLLGPNFTHLKTPLFQLHIADINVSQCCMRYIEAMKMLTDRLSSCPTLSRLPIIVNTMGFTRHMGWDLVLFAVKLTRPTLILQITSKNSKNNYISALSNEAINTSNATWAPWSLAIVDWRKPCEHELLEMHSAAERETVPGTDTLHLQPYQQRELATISYLSGIVRSSTWRYDAASLSVMEAVPYVIPFSSLYLSIPRADVPPSHILHAMNGNIVALCGIDLETTKITEHGVLTPAPGVRVLNRPCIATCYGFGIVRGVDMAREQVFINTPVSGSTMQHVNYLEGCVLMPVSLLRLNQQRNAAPYVGGSDDVPTSLVPRRRCYRPRSQNVQNTP